jgi:hypothetical protein
LKKSGGSEKTEDGGKSPYKKNLFGISMPGFLQTNKKAMKMLA